MIELFLTYESENYVADGYCKEIQVDFLVIDERIEIVLIWDSHADTEIHINDLPYDELIRIKDLTIEKRKDYLESIRNSEDF